MDITSRKRDIERDPDPKRILRMAGGAGILATGTVEGSATSAAWFGQM